MPLSGLGTVKLRNLDFLESEFFCSEYIIDNPNKNSVGTYTYLQLCLTFGMCATMSTSFEMLAESTKQ